MNNKNWVKEAALETLSDNLEHFSQEDVNRIIKIIERNCPFKQDVIYEEVGETSRKLDRILEKLDAFEPILKFIRSAVR